MRDAPFIDILLQVIRTLRRTYDRRARDHGLTLSRARTLTALARHDGVTQTELAAELAIEAPTLKRQIDALVADGFVAREPLDGDGRKNALVLTARGRDSAIVEFTGRLRREVLAGIPPEDLAKAAEVLTRITQNLKRMDKS
ncbi:MarR family winged helix-turn-helix transcriptional regulator [Paracoccus sp. T5]|uniref:MarR family winged helix-turn-helix transcriptional regulator n=1 Tax=Paracoccus sp. T5 TaxID=3402161 RepID=UPI003AEB9076